MRNRDDLESARESSHTHRERLLSLLLATDRERRQATNAIQAREKSEGPVPLSYAQERLWFLDQLGLVGAAYNVLLALRLSGELVEEALQRSFTELVRRHEGLRTRFGVNDGVPHQLIDPPSAFDLQRTDLSRVADPKQCEQRLCDCLQREQLHRFDLRKGPLLRAVLVTLNAGEHVLLITMHHIVVDGWSSGVLAKELGTLYAAYVQGQVAPLPDLPVQYADYAIWQRRWFRGEALQQQLRYWREQLSGAPAQLQLPTDRPRPAVESFKGAMLSFELPATLSRALNEFGRREGATMFMVAYSADVGR